MTRRPDFDDLVGQDVPPEERARLHRTHELLLEAGPPPELSPEMDAVPPLTTAKCEPSPIGSGLRNSAWLTRLFHCLSLRRSASMSKTFSGGQAIRVVAVTRTARSYPGARRLTRPRRRGGFELRACFCLDVGTKNGERP